MMMGSWGYGKVVKESMEIIEAEWFRRSSTTSSWAKEAQTEHLLL
jgi:hypothetical protein